MPCQVARHDSPPSSFIRASAALPATSATNTQLSPSNSTADSTIPDNEMVAQTAQRQAGQLPPAGTVTGSATTSARKRRLPLPPAPRATRLHTDTSLLQAAPAISPRSHAALQRQAQIPQAIAAALGHFGMEWHTLDEAQQQAMVTAATHLPLVPYPSGATETTLRQQQLHAVLSSIQAAQDMVWLASQRQFLPQVIEPALLTAPVPAVHYGGMTIDGPHLDQAGQRQFYLEQQCGHACAQHAVNAMVGGPLVSLADFAQWEANVQVQQESISTPMAHIVATMLAQGVHPETVLGTLQDLGIPTHVYVHRPVVNAQGLLILDSAQAHFLDSLKTDRLLLQADRYEDNSPTSHYVTFRRDADQWVLLDSLHDAPQYEIAPSDYLLHDEKIKHFTALWPQNALRGRDTPADGNSSIGVACNELAGAMNEDGSLQAFQVFAPIAQAQTVYSAHDANGHWNTRAEEFGSLLQTWNQATGEKANGSALLQHLSRLCDKELAAGRGVQVDSEGMIFEFAVQTHEQAVPVHVWRGVDGNGGVNLRLAPQPGDLGTRKALLRTMQNFVAISASRRREKPAVLS